MNYDKETILAQLEKIITDKSFSRSKINVRLLRFLVHSTLEGTEVKETTIGTAFFGKRYDPIKSDNKVRVYIYHIRKKLDEYYESTAGSDEILFRIEKGQYKVYFEKYKKPRPKLKPLYIGAASLLAILLIAALFAVFHKKTVNSFWKELMQNELKTTVVFGDYFTIEGPIPTSEKGIIRDYEINSEQELLDYLENHPEMEGQMIASRHHYFNWAAPHCSRDITEFWGRYDYPFDINQVSEFSVSQLENENLVFFGQSKAMGILKNILVENFPQYTFKSQVINRTDPKTQKESSYIDVYTTLDEKIIDYTVVAKVSMPTGNKMCFFLSDQDCGMISALQYFTQNDSVKAFYDRHQIEKSGDFLALFKVSGWQRKSYEMEFILLDKK